MRTSRSMNHRPSRRLFLAVLCFLVSLLWADSISAPGPLKKLFGNKSAKSEETKPPKRWSSFFTVDPSKILSVLVNRGGLLIPKSVEKELMALANVLHVDEAKLNLIDRELIIRNFTVGLPGQGDSLRVGRVDVRWDSYTKPCVDIEVDNVSVLVEFTNLALNRNNWNELDDAGFPPAMKDSDPASSTSSVAASRSNGSTFVRIGSIDLQGNVTTEIFSRPLDRRIANIGFSMDSLKELNDEIRRTSEANLAATGRRGCTTDELYTILSNYFMRKLRSFLSETVYDVTTGALSDEGSNTVREAKRLVSSANDVIRGYVSEASKKKGDDLQDSLANRLERFGVPSSKEKLKALREISLNAARNVDARSLAESKLKQVREAYRTGSGAANVAQNAEALARAESLSDEVDEEEAVCADKVQEEDIIFYDW